MSFALQGCNCGKDIKLEMKRTIRLSVGKTHLQEDLVVEQFYQNRLEFLFSADVTTPPNAHLRSSE